MHRRSAIIALVVMLLAPAPARAQWVKSPQDLQREAAQKMEPAQIRLHTERAPGEPRLVRLRVYAAEDYRRQTMEWQSKFRRLVERVNRVVAFWPGVRFEIESIRPWPRSSAEANLGELLEALAQLDPGTEVDRVVGLVAAVSTVPQQIDHIGMARWPGRHFVVRSLHDLAEYESVRGAFDELYPVERERLLSLRKAHKEVVIFLHEWAHTLGLVHAPRASRVMNPAYSEQQSEMSPTEVKMVEAALRAGNDPATLRRELTAIATDSPDPEWDPRDREALRGMGNTRVGGPPTPGTVTATAQPDAVRALLVQAEEQIARREEAKAEESVAQAEAALGDAKGMRAAWHAIIGLWVRLCAPTRALLAAARSDRYDLETTKSWFVGARHRFAIPFDAAGKGLAPEREGTYVRGLLAGLAALAAHQPTVAAERAAELEREFPRLPGPVILRCGLAVARMTPQARMVCNEAYRRQDDAIPTLRLVAELATKLHQPKVAAEHRAKADELER